MLFEDERESVTIDEGEEVKSKQQPNLKLENCQPDRSAITWTTHSGGGNHLRSDNSHSSEGDLWQTNFVPDRGERRDLEHSPHQRDGLETLFNDLSADSQFCSDEVREGTTSLICFQPDVCETIDSSRVPSKVLTEVATRDPAHNERVHSKVSRGEQHDVHRKACGSDHTKDLTDELIFAQCSQDGNDPNSVWRRFVFGDSSQESKSESKTVLGVKGSTTGRSSSLLVYTGSARAASSHASSSVAALFPRYPKRTSGRMMRHTAYRNPNDGDLSAASNAALEIREAPEPLDWTAVYTPSKHITASNALATARSIMNSASVPSTDRGRTKHSTFNLTSSEAGSPALTNVNVLLGSKEQYLDPTHAKRKNSRAAPAKSTRPAQFHVEDKDSSRAPSHFTVVSPCKGGTRSHRPKTDWHCGQHWNRKTHRQGDQTERLRQRQRLVKHETSVK
jgi:hypothetical protein